MRIMHVILSRGFAGSERYAAELASLQAAEHDVMLVVRRRHRNRSGTSILDAVGERVRVATVPTWFGTQRAVERCIAQFAPDVIHTHLRRSARIIARAHTAAPSVATLHIGINGPHFLQLDGLICNAHWQVLKIPPSYAGKIFKLNQLFTPHRRLAAPEIAALRASLGVGPGQFLVGAVARLARSKGLDTLIDAFRAAGLPDARLVILGEGRERRRLERLLGPHMSMPGFRKNIKDYYQAFDLFVCPSRREPLPLVMLEAYDAGLPVVASTADGCRELIEEYGGDLFPAGDAGALAAILRDRAGAPPRKMQYDLSPHFIENVGRSIFDVYGTLIAGRARGVEETMHTGGCLCGAVRYQLRGALRGVIACHCSQCRRTSGHHVAMTSTPSAQVELTTSERLLWYKSSNAAERGFCGVCGGNLFWRQFGGGDLSVTAGSLDTPTGLKMEQHIFVADKSDYYSIDDGLPQKARW